MLAVSLLHIVKTQSIYLIETTAHSAVFKK